MSNSKLYVSSSFFNGFKVSDVLDKFREIGHYNIEFSAPHTYESNSNLEKILLDAQNDGFSYTFHNYFPRPKNDFVLNISSQNNTIQESNRKLVSKSLNLASNTGTGIYGVHSGYLADAISNDKGKFEFSENQITYDNALKNSLKFITEMNQLARQSNVSLVLENLFPEIDNKVSIACTLEEINDLVVGLPQDVGLLLDLGHLNISSNLLNFDRGIFLDKFLDRYGDRLLEVHISENNGLIDEHKGLNYDSWQIDAIRQIKSHSSTVNLKQRIFCIEARKETIQKLVQTIEIVKKVLET